MIVLYIIIILIILVLIELLAEKVYMHSDEYKSFLGGAEKFKNIPNHIQICNIGSGPALYGVDYSACFRKGFNFATKQQNFKYGFRLLKHFNTNIESGAIIIIIICVPMSFGKNNNYDQKDFSDKFYGILPKSEIDNYSVKRLIISRHPLAIKYLKKVKNKLHDRKTKQISIQSIGNEPNIIKIWKEEFDLRDLVDASQINNHVIVFQEKKEILQDGINYCKKNNWTPIFVIPPLPFETKKHISEEFIKAFFYENLQEIIKNNNVRVLDYYNEDFSDDYFMNDIFLNNRGKKYFSKKLFRDIKNAMY